MTILPDNISIDFRSKSLRVIIRKNFKTIINHVVENNILRISNKQNKNLQEICMFCGSSKKITREHVIPRWTFEKCTKKYFTTNINGLNQTYNKTTIPACSICNNERLSILEDYINKIFTEIDLETTYFTYSELEYIIRWLEIVDYKFQILNARRHFLRSKETGYIPYLSDLPLSVLRPNVNYSPSKTVTEIRRSLKRLTVKNKYDNINSLMIFQTSNKGFYFFHTMDDFIFIELPKYKIALFYFYKRTFLTIHECKKEAMKIIDKVY